MEGIKIDKIDYAEHNLKCRMCFKSFNAGEHQVEITRTLELKFLDVTQTNLKISNEFSNKLCGICSLQLHNHWDYRRNVVEAQSRLYEFASVDENISIKTENETTEVEEEYFAYPMMECEFEEVNDFNQMRGQNPINGPWQLPEEIALETRMADVNRRRQLRNIDRHVCTHCNVRDVSRQNMKRHIERVHLKIKNFICDHCQYECFYRFSLVAHMNKHIDQEQRMKYFCDECDHFSASTDSLKAHRVTSHLKSPTYECSKCNETFDTYNKFYRHKLKIHREHESHVCNFCQKTLREASSLKNHIELFHANSTPSLACPIAACTKVCFTNKQLQKHVQTHNEDARKCCPVCGILVANKPSLDRHIARVHLKVRNFHCDICDYQGFFKFNIVDHMKKHLNFNEREQFFCDESGCVFQSVSKPSLRLHKRSAHLGQKRIYTCHCGKVFTQNSSYYTHVKMVHERQKNYSCKLCPKSFFEKGQLKNHIKSQHLKQKDIPCKNCGKLFATKKHLTYHMVYHAPPKHICEYPDCGQQFFTPSQLKSHIKVHNNQRDYKCHLCEKSYFRKSHLKKHLLTHGIF